MSQSPIQSSVQDFGVQDNTAGTALPPFQMTDLTTGGALGTEALTFTSSTSWSSEDKEAFLTEWKKLRLELLPLLLRDDYWPIKGMEIISRWRQRHIAYVRYFS